MGSEAVPRWSRRVDLGAASQWPATLFLHLLRVLDVAVRQLTARAVDSADEDSGTAPIDETCGAGTVHEATASCVMMCLLHMTSVCPVAMLVQCGVWLSREPAAARILGAFPGALSPPHTAAAMAQVRRTATVS